MNHPSSPPASISSGGTAAASASTSIQPIYTTAGTIYNPGTSQPLQPPTRRGRSFKWGAGGSHSDLGYFSKSGLVPLPLKPGSGSGRVTTSASFQHYTPLQQNYDRAVSPLNDPDHQQAARMPPPQAPRLRPIDDAPPLPPSLFPALSHDKSIDGNTSDDSDDDSDFGTDPLMNMTVKSLHNLASYPNPNQKRAQKALLRGARPNLNSLTAASRMNPSPSYPTFGSFEPSRDVGDRPLSILRSAFSDPSTHRQGQAEGRSRFLDFGRAASSLSVESRLSSPAPTSDVAESALSASTTLAFGPGAPRPLTAGPPGQRQYRPSTFESTFKALQTRSQPQSSAYDDEETLSMTQKILLQAGIDDLSLNSDPFASQFGTGLQLFSASDSKAPARPIGFERGATSSFEGQRDDIFMMKEHSAFFSSHSDMTSRPTWGCHAEHRHDDLRHFPSVSRLRFKPGTPRWADEEIEERNARINHLWYAGIEPCGNTPATTFVDEQPRYMKNIYGAVGDGRPTKKEQSGVVKDQDQAGPSSSDEVFASESTESLMKSALLKMLRSEATGSSHTPESMPWLRDQESDNRMSFFGNTFQRIN